MKTKLNLSSKMHLFIIITSVIIAVGVAMGVIFHCVSDKYFNYGGDFATYKSVTVTYADIDFSGKDDDPEKIMDGICEKAFASSGIKYYSKEYGDKNGGGNITYKFVDTTESGKLDGAIEKITAAIDETQGGDTMFSNASWQTVRARYEGSKAFKRGAIALATIVVFHFLYFIIRYKLTMAFAAVLADAHNLALYLSLLAITRVPVNSAVMTFAVLTVVMTMIGTCFLFDRMRKNIKNEAYAKLSAAELTDLTANETFLTNAIMPACIAVVAVLVFVFMSISSLSPLAVMAPAFMALFGCMACVYGTGMFVPSIYSRFKKIGDDYKAKHTRKAKSKKQ